MITYIHIDHDFRIEVMDGKYYPTRLVNPQWRDHAEGWGHKKTGNKWASYKTETGAMKIINQWIAETPVEKRVALALYGAWSTLASEMEFKQFQAALNAEMEAEKEVSVDEATSIVEQAQNQDLRDYVPGDTFYIYGSPLRPMSASWAHIPQAVFVNANKVVNDIYMYTFIVASYELDDKTIASYELVKLYGPVVWKPDEVIDLPIPIFEEVPTDDSKQYDLFIGQAANKVNVPLDCFKQWHELELDVQAGLHLNWQVPQTKSVPSTTIQLVIHLNTSSISTYAASECISGMFPRGTIGGIIYSVKNGTVTLTLKQEYLTDTQRDWLHLSTFASEHIQSYNVTPRNGFSKTIYDTHQVEENYWKKLGI